MSVKNKHVASHSNKYKHNIEHTRLMERANVLSLYYAII